MGYLQIGGDARCRALHLRLSIEAANEREVFKFWAVNVVLRHYTFPTALAPLVDTTPFVPYFGLQISDLYRTPHRKRVWS